MPSLSHFLFKTSSGLNGKIIMNFWFWSMSAGRFLKETTLMDVIFTFDRADNSHFFFGNNNISRQPIRGWGDLSISFSRKIHVHSFLCIY